MDKCYKFVSVCNQPATHTNSAFHNSGSVNEDQLRLEWKRQVWFIPLSDVHGVCRKNWDPL